MDAPLGLEVAAVLEMDQGIQLRIHLKNDVTPLAAVPTGRTTVRDKFFPAEGHRAVAAITRFYVDFRFVEEHFTIQQE